MENATCVTVRSRSGISLSIPRDWTSEEDDTAFTVFPPANASINIFLYEKAQWIEGAAVMLPNHSPLDYFKILMVSGVIAKRPTLKWRPGDWSTDVIGGNSAIKTNLIAEGEPLLQWRLYVFETERAFCAILLEAAQYAIPTNDSEYDKVIRSLTLAGGAKTPAHASSEPRVAVKPKKPWWKFW